jgi:hypothetical protein
VKASHYTEAKAVRDEILSLNLARHPRFGELSEIRFAQIYNGIGPDDWPAELRAAMTFVYREFKSLPGVHDVDFYYSDGSDAGFKASLDRWDANGRVLLDLRFPRWKFWLWRDRARAWALIRAAWLALRGFSRPWYNRAAFDRGPAL